MRKSRYFARNAIRKITGKSGSNITISPIVNHGEVVKFGIPVIATIIPDRKPMTIANGILITSPRQKSAHQNRSVRAQVSSNSCMCRSPERLLVLFQSG